jgi:hypothetical protein
VLTGIAVPLLGIVLIAAGAAVAIAMIRRNIRDHEELKRRGDRR